EFRRVLFRSNSHGFRHYPLKIACLPISPPRHSRCRALLASSARCNKGADYSLCAPGGVNALFQSHESGHGDRFALEAELSGDFAAARELQGQATPFEWRGGLAFEQREQRGFIDTVAMRVLYFGQKKR